MAKRFTKRMPDSVKAIKVLQVFILMLIVIVAAILVTKVTSINEYVVLTVTVLIEALLYFTARRLKYK